MCKNVATATDVAKGKKKGFGHEYVDKSRPRLFSGRRHLNSDDVALHLLLWLLPATVCYLFTFTVPTILDAPHLTTAERASTIPAWFSHTVEDHCHWERRPNCFNFVAITGYLYTGPLQRVLQLRVTSKQLPALFTYISRCRKLITASRCYPGWWTRIPTTSLWNPLQCPPQILHQRIRRLRGKVAPKRRPLHQHQKQRERKLPRAAQALGLEPGQSQQQHRRTGEKPSPIEPTNRMRAIQRVVTNLNRMRMLRWTM